MFQPFSLSFRNNYIFCSLFLPPLVKSLFKRKKKFTGISILQLPFFNYGKCVPTIRKQDEEYVST